MFDGLFPMIASVIIFTKHKNALSYYLFLIIIQIKKYVGVSRRPIEVGVAFGRFVILQ